jgi:hypothetical protein
MATICEEIIVLKIQLDHDLPNCNYGLMLHTIRKMAQEMENGLQRRKEFLESKGLEQEYQDWKKQQNVTGYQNMPDAINEVAESPEVKVNKGGADIEIIVKDHNKVLYHNKGVALVGCFIERIISVDQKIGMVNAQQQHLVAGNPHAILHGYNMIHEHMKKNVPELLMKVMEHVEQDAFKRMVGMDKKDAMQRMTEAMK